MVNDKIPAYMRVYNTLKSRILDGGYAVGDLLPPEPELEKLFSVSRTTVRKAAEMLAHEGLISARQGKGTVILDHHTTQNINHVTSLSETLEQKGVEVYSKNMYIETVPASQRVAGELEIDPGDPVVMIQRIQIADGKPIAIFKNYLRPELVPGIESYTGKFSRLYDFLEERYGLLIDSACDRISARSATFEESSMLDVPVGSALIYLVRVCRSGSKIVGADHCKILGNRYEFEVHMSGRVKTQ